MSQLSIVILVAAVLTIVPSCWLVYVWYYSRFVWVGDRYGQFFIEGYTEVGYTFMFKCSCPAYNFPGEEKKAIRAIRAWVSLKGGTLTTITRQRDRAVIYKKEI